MSWVLAAVHRAFLLMLRQMHRFLHLRREALDVTRLHTTVLQCLHLYCHPLPSAALASAEVWYTSRTSAKSLKCLPASRRYKDTTFLRCKRLQCSALPDSHRLPADREHVVSHSLHPRRRLQRLLCSCGSRLMTGSCGVTATGLHCALLELPPVQSSTPLLVNRILQFVIVSPVVATTDISGVLMGHRERTAKDAGCTKSSKLSITQRAAIDS